jgi:sulfur carrier protein
MLRSNIFSRVGGSLNKLVIQVNGEPKEVGQGWTVARLVRDLGKDRRTVAVEFNGKILAREKYSLTPLSPTDRVEIVHFVQGG